MAFKRAFLAVFVLTTLFAAWPTNASSAMVQSISDATMSMPCHDSGPSAPLCQGQCGAACCKVVMHVAPALYAPILIFVHQDAVAGLLTPQDIEPLMRPPIA